MNKKISIIVPVYNVEKYLVRCLDSIISQSYNDWELIIINDGSKDKCDEICKQYLTSDTRVKYVYEENRGQSVARNLGLEMATGNYVCFVDSDDWLEKDYLYTLYNEISAGAYDMVVCGYYISDDKSDRIVKVTNEDCNLNHMQFVHNIANNTIENFAWNKIYRIELFDSVRFKEGVYYEDVRIMDQMIDHIQNVRVINKPLYHYYMRDDSTVHQKSVKKEKDYFEAFENRYFNTEIHNSDKKFIIKNLIVSFYYLLQISYKEAKQKKAFLKKLPKQNIRDAVVLLNKKEKIRWFLSYNFTLVYYCSVKCIKFIVK